MCREGKDQNREGTHRDKVQNMRLKIRRPQKRELERGKKIKERETAKGIRRQRDEARR